MSDDYSAEVCRVRHQELEKCLKNLSEKIDDISNRLFQTHGTEMLIERVLEKIKNSLSVIAIIVTIGVSIIAYRVTITSGKTPTSFQLVTPTVQVETPIVNVVKP